MCNTCHTSRRPDSPLAAFVTGGGVLGVLRVLGGGPGVARGAVLVGGRAVRAQALNSASCTPMGKGADPARDGVRCIATTWERASKRCWRRTKAGAGWAATRLYETLAGRVAGYLRAQGVTDFEDAQPDLRSPVAASAQQPGTEANL